MRRHDHPTTTRAVAGRRAQCSVGNRTGHGQSLLFSLQTTELQKVPGPPERSGSNRATGGVRFGRPLRLLASGGVDGRGRRQQPSWEQPRHSPVPSGVLCQSVVGAGDIRDTSEH